VIIFFKENNFFVLWLTAIMITFGRSSSSDTQKTENITVAGTTRFDDKVNTNEGIHITNGIFISSGVININGEGSNSFTVTLGNVLQPSTIIFNNIPQGDQTQKLGFLTLNPDGVIYVSFDITPLPTDPYQVDSITVQEILNRNDTTILINSTEGNNSDNVILGNTIIGNNESTITLESGSIFFNGPISSNSGNIFFTQPCFFTVPISTDQINTTDVFFGSEDLADPLSITITNQTNITANNFLAKNNLTISNPQESIIFENNTIAIGAASPGGTVTMSTLSLPNLPTVTKRDSDNSYLAVLEQEPNYLTLVKMPKMMTLDAASLDNGLEINFINANTQNNTVINTNNITFQAPQLSLNGTIDSNQQTLTISAPVIFQEDVFIGASSIEDFIAQKKIDFLKHEKEKRKKLKKEIENFYKEITKIYE
jgi:hypothetical protein